MGRNCTRVNYNRWTENFYGFALTVNKDGTGEICLQNIILKNRKTEENNDRDKGCR